MTGGWGRAFTAGATCAAILGIPDRTAVAQDADGLRITGSIQTGVEFDDNGGSDWDTALFSDLRVGVVSETPNQTLAFTIGGRLQAENRADGEEDNGFIEPFATLSYNLEGPDSELDFSARYTERDVDDSFAFDFDDDLIIDEVLTSEGEVSTTSADLRYGFGLSAPFGGEVLLRHTSRDYTNTVSPDLADEETNTVRLTANFRPRQTLTFRTFVEERRYTSDDIEETERDTTLYGIGVDYEIDPALRFSGDLSFDEVEETTTAGVDTNDGIGLDFRLTQDRPNGTIALFGSREVSTDTTRSQIGIRREMELPGAALSFSLSVSDSDEGDTVLLGGFGYQRELPRGVLSADFSQTARSNEDEEEVLSSILSVDYRHEVSPRATLGLGVTYARSDDIGVGDANEGERADLRVTYSQELNEDWNWSVSYRASRIEEDDGSDETTNTISASIGRSFSLRP